MVPSVREDKAWACGWLLCGIPAMVAGYIQGARHEDSVMMVGTAIMTVVLLVTTIPILRK